MSGILQLLLGQVVAGGYTVIERFLASGTWTAPTGVTATDYLVVAGGGGGGATTGAGGSGIVILKVN